MCMLALEPTRAPERQQLVRLDRCRWEDGGGAAPKTSLPNQALGESERFLVSRFDLTCEEALTCSV